MPPGRSTSDRGIEDTATNGRAMRAHARRNREALLASAAQAFSARGVDTSLEHIARSAGVGIGTLYRHFPTREALIANVYHKEVQLLCDIVDALLEQHPADHALTQWMGRFVTHVVSRRGMATALKAAVSTQSEVFAAIRADIIAAMNRLILPAVEQDLIRPDVAPNDVLGALCGFCLVSDQPSEQDRTLRQVELLVDGLRYRTTQSVMAIRSSKLSGNPTPSGEEEPIQAS